MGYGAILGQTPELGDSFEVGDILTTVKENRGANWLLCDGSSVSRASYPELSKLFPASPSDSWTTATSNISQPVVREIIYANGYYVARSGSFGSVNTISYTTDLQGTWTNVNITALDLITKIAYVNGYWMICGGWEGINPDYSSSSWRNWPKILYNATLDANINNWNSLYIGAFFDEDGNTPTITDIIYDGTYYLVSATGKSDGRKQTYPYVYYSSSLNANFRTWREVQYFKDEVGWSIVDNNVVNKILKINNNYCFLGDFVDEKPGYIYYTDLTASDNSWTKVNVTNAISDAVLINGNYLLLSYGNKQFTFTNNLLTSSPSLTTITLPDTYYSFAFDGVNYVFAGNKKIMWSNSLTGSWTTVNITVPLSNLTNAEIIIDNNYIPVVYWGHNEGTNPYYSMLQSDNFILPNLDFGERTNTFIKASN